MFPRYAVAPKTLEPGDLICSEIPFSYGPKYDCSPVCLGCHELVDCLHLCPECSWPVCNDECSKKDIHAKFECEVRLSLSLSLIFYLVLLEKTRRQGERVVGFLVFKWREKLSFPRGRGRWRGEMHPFQCRWYRYRGQRGLFLNIVMACEKLSYHFRSRSFPEKKYIQKYGLGNGSARIFWKCWKNNAI